MVSILVIATYIIGFAPVTAITSIKLTRYFNKDTPSTAPMENALMGCTFGLVTGIFWPITLPFIMFASAIKKVTAKV